MKNLARISFFAVAVMFLVSCGDDPKPSLNLVGKWQLENTTADLEVDGKPLKDYLIAQGQTAAQAQATIDEINSQIEFSKLTGTIEFKDDATFVGVLTDDNGDDQSGSGTWKLSDDKKTLSLTESGTTTADVFTIADYTSTTVSIKQLVDSDSSMGVKIDFYLVLKLKKI